MDYLEGSVETLREENRSKKQEIVSYLDQIVQAQDEPNKLLLDNNSSKNTYITELCKFEQQIHHKLTEITYELKKFISLNKPPVYKPVTPKKNSDVDPLDIETLKASSAQLLLKLEEYSKKEETSVHEEVCYPYVSKNTLEQLSDKKEETSVEEEVCYPYVSKNTLEQLSDHTKDMLKELVTNKNSHYEITSGNTLYCGHFPEIEEKFPAISRSCSVCSTVTGNTVNVFEHFPLSDYSSQKLTELCGPILKNESRNEDFLDQDSTFNLYSAQTGTTEDSFLDCTSVASENRDDGKSELSDKHSISVDGITDISKHEEKGIKCENVENIFPIRGIETNDILLDEEFDKTIIKAVEEKYHNKGYEISKDNNYGNLLIPEQKWLETNNKLEISENDVHLAELTELQSNSTEYYSGEDDLLDEKQCFGSNEKKMNLLDVMQTGMEEMEELYQSLKCAQENSLLDLKKVDLTPDVGILIDFDNVTSQISEIKQEESSAEISRDLSEDVSDVTLTNVKAEESLCETSDSECSKLNNELCVSKNEGSNEISEFDSDRRSSEPKKKKKHRVHTESSARSSISKNQSLKDSPRFQNNFEDDRDKLCRGECTANNETSDEPGIQDSVKDCNLNANVAKPVYSAHEKILKLGLMDRRTRFEQTREIAILPDLRLQPSVSDNEKIKQMQKEGNKFEIAKRFIPHTYATCVFSHVESPSEFYIHLDNEESKLLDSLNELITKHFKHTRTPYRSKFEAFKSIGKFCCTYIKDDKTYYRAEVLEWYFETETKLVLVQLVDYGNKTLVHYKHLRELNKDFCLIARIAIKCYLPMLYPPGSTKSNLLSDWPVATIEAVRELCLLCQVGELMYFKIFYIQNEEDITGVDLFKVGEDELQSIGQLLIDLGHAVQIILPKDDPMGVSLDDEEIKRMESCNTINEVVLGYEPKDERRICRFTREDGTCFKGNNCKLEHANFARGGYTTDYILTYASAINDILLPKEAELIQIKFTMFLGASHYYINLMNFADALAKLESMINDKRNSSTLEPYRIMPAYGEIVLVKHWTQRWLRAKVRHHSYDEEGNCTQIQVFMVDYGDVIDVPLNDVRHIKPEYLNLPFQAVECILYNYKARNDVNLKEVDTFFYNNMVFREFSAQVMGVSDMLLALKVSHKDQDIGDILVEKGFLTKVHVLFPCGIVIPG